MFIPEPSRYPPAGLLRRLGAMVSDSLVVVGLLLLGTLVFVPLLHRLDAKALVPSEVGWFWASVYWVWLLSIWIGFFTYFWVKRGQTVGMQAWRLRVEDEQGRLLTWSMALKRIALAAAPWLPSLIILEVAEHYRSTACKYLGLAALILGVAGLLSMYADSQRRTWHDRLSVSRVVKL